jgi:hypothetical protein
MNECSYAIVDNIEDAKIAVRSLQRHDGPYVDEAYKNFINIIYPADYSIEDEDGNVVLEDYFDLDNDVENLSFDIPSGKYLVFYTGRFNGLIDYEFESESEINEEDIDYDYNITKFQYLSGVSKMRIFDKEIKFPESEDGECEEEYYFIFDSDMNIVQEGDPSEDEDIPDLD